MKDPRRSKSDLYQQVITPNDFEADPFLPSVHPRHGQAADLESPAVEIIHLSAPLTCQQIEKVLLALVIRSPYVPAPDECEARLPKQKIAYTVHTNSTALPLGVFVA